MLKSDEDLRKLLADQIKAAGSQRNAAAQLGFSSQFINDVLHGRRNITEAMATALGYQRAERIWEPIKDKEPKP